MKTKKNENKSKQRSNRNKSSKIKNSKNTLKYMINKDINMKYRSKADIVEHIFKTTEEVADEHDKNELTDSNYIYWITNDLAGMYMDPDDSTMDKKLNKLIEGPSYETNYHNLKEGAKRKKLIKKQVLKTQEHVRNLLMKLPNKELYAFIGYSFYNSIYRPKVA